MPGSSQYLHFLHEDFRDSCSLRQRLPDHGSSPRPGQAHRRGRFARLGERLCRALGLDRLGPDQ